MDQDPPKGTTLLLFGLPPPSLCGIDLLSFQTSPRFKGIKHIPPGWHFLFAAVNDALSIRHGAWFFVPDSAVARSLVVVKPWDPQNEQFEDTNTESSLAPSKSYLDDIWREGLTPYRSSPPTKPDELGEQSFDKENDWCRLTDCITEPILTRILGPKDSQRCWSLDSASSAQADVDHIPGLGKYNPALHEEKELGLLPVDLKQTWRQGAIGRERTEAAQDRSWALSNLVDAYCQQLQDIVGELQFSFIMVLTLNNHSCLEQWKRLLTLVLTCKSAVLQHSGFFVDFLSCLRLQLEHSQAAQGGLFDLSEDGAPLLKLLLKRFRNGLDQQSGPDKATVMDELEELEDYLKLEHDWVTGEPQVRSGMLQLEDGEQVQMDMSGVDEEDDMGEYAPVIVDLTAEQASALHLQLEHSTSAPRASGITKLQRDIDNESNGQPNQESDEEADLEDMDARY